MEEEDNSKKSSQPVNDFLLNKGKIVSIMPLKGFDYDELLRDKENGSEKDTSGSSIFSPIMKQKINLMNRLKDFVCIILSYPSSTLDRSDSEWWTKSCLTISSDIQNLDKVYDLEEEVSFRFDWFHRIILPQIDIYLPPDIIEMSTNPALGLEFRLRELSVPPKVTQMMDIPPAIYASAINHALRQVLECIGKQHFTCIGISGNGGKQVLGALKDLPRIRRMFNVVLSVSISKHVTVGDVQEDIIQQLCQQIEGVQFYGLLPTFLERKDVLLLLDDVDAKINIDKLGIPRDKSLLFDHKVVFATGLPSAYHVMSVDLEIRMEDHFLPWELFCRNMGEVVHSSAIQPMAIRVVEKCCGHLHATLLIAKALREEKSIVVWETAISYLSSETLPVLGRVNEVMVNVLSFIWGREDYGTKLCIRYSALCISNQGVKRTSLISKWIEHGFVDTIDEGESILHHLVSSFVLETAWEGDAIFMQKKIRDVIVKLFKPELFTRYLKRDCLRLTEPPRDEEWNAEEIHLMHNYLSDLPNSPWCPMLRKLFLQMNQELTYIPSEFFEHMPVLEVLDMSNTSIKFLPKLDKLVTLRELFLRCCPLFMELPSEIGKLRNLEVLDLEGTEICNLPVDMMNLVQLKCLKVSFYGYVNRSRKSDQLKAMIPEGVISHLSQLNELCMYVNPDDQRWNLAVTYVLKELPKLRQLNVLKLYLPGVKFLRDSFLKEMACQLSTCFRFTVGSHMKRIIGQVPQELEVQFEKWNKCLRYVNGKGIPEEVIIMLQYSTSFFLDRHSTIITLSEFGKYSLQNLRFLLLGECNSLQTIIDGRKFCEKINGDGDDEGKALESLEYLSIHYMKILEDIWIGPIHEGCLCKLKSLTLQTCPKLTFIFTLELLCNLRALEELVVEDCTAIKSLVTEESPSGCELTSHEAGCFLPKLRKLSLHYLPNLTNISGGHRIALNLEWMSFYDCPNLRKLSVEEVSSTEIKVIRGESDWWSTLSWDEPEWPNGRPEHFDFVFFSISRDLDLMSQLAVDESSLQASRQKHMLHAGR